MFETKLVLVCKTNLSKFILNKILKQILLTPPVNKTLRDQNDWDRKTFVEPNLKNQNWRSNWKSILSSISRARDKNYSLHFGERKIKKVKVKVLFHLKCIPVNATQRT